jgi:hypothetical protein
MVYKEAETMIKSLIILGLLLAGIVAASIAKIIVKNKYVLLGNAQEKIKGVMLHLVFEAEKLYMSGTGQFKKAYVINLILNGEFYKGLPLGVQKLLTFGVLSELVDKVVGGTFNPQKMTNAAVKKRLEGLQ